MITPDDLTDAAAYLKRAKATFTSYVVKAAQEGMTQREIAKALGMSYSGVAAILRKAGVKYEIRAVSPDS